MIKVSLLFVLLAVCAGCKSKPDLYAAPDKDGELKLMDREKYKAYRKQKSREDAIGFGIGIYPSTPMNITPRQK